MHILTSLTGYALSAILMLGIFPLLLIQSLGRNQKIFEPVLKRVCRLVPGTFGIHVKVEGLENLNGRKNMVFIANHVNLLDLLIVYGFIPRYLRGVELESHFSWPVWGMMIKLMGHIPISHKDPKSAIKSLEMASREIREGTSIIIFPEGHRTRDGKLQPFMGGAFRLARMAEVPICPVGLKGLWERKTVHSLWVRPGEVRVIFGQVMEYKTILETPDRELRKQGRTCLEAILADGQRKK